jgi:hypothetical protein
MRALRTLTLVGVLGIVAAARGAEWTPRRYADTNTIELRTTAPGEKEHWFPVWVVVIDDQVYVRLGSRAAKRIASNQTAPYVGVRVLGDEFPRVKGEPAPAEAERVAEAMSAKYWSDILIHLFSHPLTLRLVPAPDGG